MNTYFTIFQYITYLLKARNEHFLHSPFAYDFYTKIIKGKTSCAEQLEIEGVRKKLKKDIRRIEIVDFGAGSGIDNANSKKISSICKNAEKKPALAQLIYRIIKFQQPAIMLDLGTSLGITTLYESRANPLGLVYTFEGCPATAAVAKENFDALSAKNIKQVVGNIDDTLPLIIAQLPSIDFVFFDANHRYEPTLNYFLQCLEKANEDSIFIFDDIYWSEEMNRVWKELKKHPSVGMSMDLFYLGILFFRKKQPVQHFIVR